MQNTFMGADVEVAREDLVARFLELMLKWFEELLNSIIHSVPMTTVPQTKNYLLA